MDRSQLKTFKDLFKYSTEKFSQNIAFAVVDGPKMTYADFKNKVEETLKTLDNFSIKLSDKVAIFSQNMPNWPISFFSVVEKGAVAVPILPDFSEMEVTNIIKHSEAKAIFVSKKLLPRLTEETKAMLDLIIIIDTLEIFKSSEKITPNNEREDYNEDHLASIIYTSGTTGSSKGVMLSHKNLISHLHACNKLRPSYEWDRWMSLLPLSHTLELSLGMTLAICSGASIYFLDKAPTPSILLKAFKEVKPTTLCIVPLIIEKIFNSSVLPNLTKSMFIKSVYETSLGRKILHRVAGKKLMASFGGKVRFMGIGGAKLDGIVERFLLEAKFPYTIGYGLTECSPLLAGSAPHLHDKWQSTGKKLECVELKIYNPDPVTGEGEIVAKGPNITKGYYKNPEATKEAFTEDGWFRTKDLGIFDAEGNLYIRGRVSNMILGASGENIYPEEIEAVINTHADVAESLVSESKGKLIARVYFNQEKIDRLKVKSEEINQAYHEKKLEIISNYNAKLELFKKEYSGKKEEFSDIFNQKRKEYFDTYSSQRDSIVKSYNEHKEEALCTFNSSLEQMKSEVLKYVNSKVNKFSRISLVMVQPDQFEKTATLKIKRYKYKD